MILNQIFSDIIVTSVIHMRHGIIPSLIRLLFLQVRDYIHVVDLADGHIAALQKLFENSSIG
jgi:nucleoside-diphosphate-sugar epimerase